MKKNPLLFLTGGIIFYIFYFLSFPVLSLEKDGERVFLRYVKPGDTFLLGYLHSVSKTDVWEKFAINDEYQMELIETMFQGQGAGLPYNIRDNEKLIRQDSWFIITGMKRPVPVIHWRVDSHWQSRFRFGPEKIIWAASLAGDGLIQIKTGRVKFKDWINYHFLKNLADKREITK